MSLARTAATAGRVCLVDDNAAFLDSTAWLLESAGLQVECFASAEAFLLEARPESSPRCLVSDIRMQGMSGLQLQDALQRRGEVWPLVFVTAHGDVPLAVEAMRRGASDFIEKPFSDETLLAAVNRALQASCSVRGPADEALARLTPRERQVMELVVDGTPNKLIADRLGISIKTVELHRSNMMARLGTRSLPELMKLVLGHGR